MTKFASRWDVQLAEGSGTEDLEQGVLSFSLSFAELIDGKNGHTPDSTRSNDLRTFRLSALRRAFA